MAGAHYEPAIGPALSKDSGAAFTRPASSRDLTSAMGRGTTMPHRLAALEQFSSGTMQMSLIMPRLAQCCGGTTPVCDVMSP